MKSKQSYKFNYKIIAIIALIFLLIFSIVVNATFIPKYFAYKDLVHSKGIRITITAEDDTADNHHQTIFTSEYLAKEATLSDLLSLYPEIYEVETTLASDWLLAIDYNNARYYGDAYKTSPYYWAISSSTNYSCVNNHTDKSPIKNYCAVGISDLKLSDKDIYHLYFIKKNA